MAEGAPLPTLPGDSGGGPPRSPAPGRGGAGRRIRQDRRRTLASHPASGNGDGVAGPHRRPGIARVDRGYARMSHDRGRLGQDVSPGWSGTGTGRRRREANLAAPPLALACPAAVHFGDPSSPRWLGTGVAFGGWESTAGRPSPLRGGEWSRLCGPGAPAPAVAPSPVIGPAVPRVVVPGPLRFRPDAVSTTLSRPPAPSSVGIGPWRHSRHGYRATHPRIDRLQRGD
jgi:hypothetical protein